MRIGTKADWLSRVPFYGDYLATLRLRREKRKQTAHVRRYATAVLHGLAVAGKISEEVVSDQLQVRDEVGRDISIHLEVDNSADQRIFALALGELFEILRQPAPRYLLRTRNRWFAVPSELDGHADSAKAFQAAWSAHVRKRPALYYVHSKEGRKAMLEAKREALLGRFTWKSAARTCWK